MDDNNLNKDDVNITMAPGSAKITVSKENQNIDSIGINMPKNELMKDAVNDVSAGNDVADQFTGLPIEALICNPIVAAAKAQQELTAVYIDGLMKLAYKDGKAGGDTNVLNFKFNRPVIKQDGNITSQQYSIDAPLLSLVPVPAFTMDEVTVDFNMEVKDSVMSSDKTHDDLSTTVSYNSWFGLDTKITGNISSDKEHKRQTDSSATYTIHARAVQQPPSEGMAKLTSLFAQAMEPIDLSKNK